MPPEFGAGVNLFPSAEGYRPGRNEFAIEGIPVPESMFMQIVNSGQIGGAFGLLEISNRMATREVGRWKKTVSWNKTHETIGIDSATGDLVIGTHTTTKSFSFTTSIVYETRWSASELLMVAAWTQRQTEQSQQSEKVPEKTRNMFDEAIDDALKALEKESCRNLFGEDVNPAALLQSLYSAVGPTLGAIELDDLGAYEVERNDQGRIISRSGLGGLTKGISGTFFNKNGKLINIFTGAHIRINSNKNGPFVEGFYDYLGVGASNRTYRAITIIHELGHAIARIYGPKSSKILDDEASQVSEDNSQRVYDACFKN